MPSLSDAELEVCLTETRIWTSLCDNARHKNDTRLQVVDSVEDKCSADNSGHFVYS